MSKKHISQEKIIQSFLFSAFDKSAGATSLTDIADVLEIKKASLYNHFESRDAMYEATLDFCSAEIALVNFLFDKTIESIKTNRLLPQTLFKRLITRYFNLFESEPLFQMYSFVYTEQFFNLKALQIVRNLNQKLSQEIRKILVAFVDCDRIKILNERELNDYSLSISSIILQQIDFYIANRKETVRLNPESGVGTLFALPSDDNAIEKAIKSVEAILSLLQIKWFL